MTRFNGSALKQAQDTRVYRGNPMSSGALREAHERFHVSE